MKILLVLPVYNEEKILENSVNRLINYFEKNIVGDYLIVIANNASTDRTSEIGENLSSKYDNVEIINFDFKGRGNALKQTWKLYGADIYAYCDIDLATDINHLAELFDEIKKGNDLAIGNRYLKDSNTQRTFKRIIFSKVYIWLVQIFFRTKITDFQCGFKSISRNAVDELLPFVRDKEWFFDTELLLLAEGEDYKIKQIAVRWKEMEDSKVKLFKTSWDYVVKLIKLKKQVWIKN